MPFLGQDWRSPGEQWVKTTEGWEKMWLWRRKLLESLNTNIIARLLKLANIEDIHDILYHKDIEAGATQPHLLIAKGITREQKRQTIIVEALSQLDFTGAIKDVRRFTYVAQLLEFLIQNKLANLSGAAQKLVFNMLQEILDEVIRTRNNKHVMRKLMKETRVALQRGRYEHVGSSSLWEHHTDTINKMEELLEEVALKERTEDGQLTMSDLPDDCIYQILQRLSDHRDLVHAGLTETRTCDLVQDRYLWRDLCLFHFDNRQLCSVVRKGEELDRLDWTVLYSRLVKRYGMKNMYADMLHLCSHCNALYWQHHGHPCPYRKAEPKAIPVMPNMFCRLFET